jgi:hypothetical protein
VVEVGIVCSTIKAQAHSADYLEFNLGCSSLHCVGFPILNSMAEHKNSPSCGFLSMCCVLPGGYNPIIIVDYNNDKPYSGITSTHHQRHRNPQRKTVPQDVYPSPSP